MRSSPRPLLALAVLALLAGPALALAASPGAEALPPGGPPCAVPAEVHPGLPRVDAGPDQIVAIDFRLPAATTGTVAVWFALRASAANPAWPAERATAAGFLEAADGTLLDRLLGSVAVYPYGVQVDAPVGTLRAGPAEGGCWGAFGDARELALPAGDYRLVVLGASEAGSTFAAFLPAGAQVLGTRAGPAQELSAATLACDAKARALAAGVFVEVLKGCALPVRAEGHAYRALIATWGPSPWHDVRWRDPAGAEVRCYKAPNWCADVVRGGPGTWTLEVPTYVAGRQPFAIVPLGLDYNGLFGVAAGLP